MLVTRSAVCHSLTYQKEKGQFRGLGILVLSITLMHALLKSFPVLSASLQVVPHTGIYCKCSGSLILFIKTVLFMAYVVCFYFPFIYLLFF